MFFNVTRELVKEKINEYLMLLKDSGIVNDLNLLNKFRIILNNIEILPIYNAPGDARVCANKLEFCNENIIKNVQIHGLYYLDEVLFHEFSHLLNSFHKSIYGPNSFMISNAIETKMSNFTTIELLEQSDSLLYNQDPYLGIILLDEFIAQTVAQILVKYKYNNLDNIQKHEYARSELKEYELNNFKTKISEPPIQLPTTLADYPEFDICAKWFIKKYKLGTYEKFITNSFDENYLINIIENLDSQTAENMYVDLCYLGLIKEGVTIKRGFTSSNDLNDPVNNPKNIYKAFQRILRKNN